MIVPLRNRTQSAQTHRKSKNISGGFSPRLCKNSAQGILGKRNDWNNWRGVQRLRQHAGVCDRPNTGIRSFGRWIDPDFRMQDSQWRTRSRSHRHHDKRQTARDRSSIDRDSRYGFEGAGDASLEDVGGAGSLSELSGRRHKLGKIGTQHCGWNAGELDHARENGFINLPGAGFPSGNRNARDRESGGESFLALPAVVEAVFREGVCHSSFLYQSGRKHNPPSEENLPSWCRDFNRSGRYPL